MQFLKKTKLSIFFTLLLFSGCQDSVNEFTPISNKAEVQTPSLQLSKENLLATISTTEFTEQLPEYLGEFKVSQNILFDNFSGHHIGITPFNKDSKVLGLVLSSKKDSNWRHVLIEKNKLAEYYNQPQESLTPSSSMIRKLFDVLSEGSQSMSSMSNHSLNQASSNNIASSRSLESLSNDSKNEWVENCEWYESFRYTGDDGIIYYSEYSLHCYWEYQWESSPGTVIIDAGGSGGGGGAYVLPEELKDQNSFPPLDYNTISKSKRISRILNFIRYNNKNNIAETDLNKAFINMPKFTSSGYPYDNFTGRVRLGNESIEITLIEIPLAESFRTFNSNGHSYQVSTPGGYRMNIRYTVPCGGCSHPLGSLLIQVNMNQYDKIIKFLNGQ